jgi:hypothetical protein
MTAPNPSNPYGIQVVMKPGGLSSTAHLVNVIVVLLTCGLWIPVWIILAIAAPVKQAEVMAPPGTPQDAINAAYNAAVELTPDERANRNRTFLVFGILAGGVVLLCVGGFAISALTGR